MKVILDESPEDETQPRTNLEIEPYFQHWRRESEWKKLDQGITCIHIGRGVESRWEYGILLQPAVEIPDCLERIGLIEIIHPDMHYVSVFDRSPIGTFKIV